jgi:hypothetical protein
MQLTYADLVLPGKDFQQADRDDRVSNSITDLAVMKQVAEVTHFCSPMVTPLHKSHVQRGAGSIRISGSLSSPQTSEYFLYLTVQLLSFGSALLGTPLLAFTTVSWT